MTSLGLTFIEPLDAVAIPGVTLTATAVVTVRVRLPQLDPPPTPPPGGSVDTVAPQQSGSPGRVQVMRTPVGRQTMVTDANGVAEFRWTYRPRSALRRAWDSYDSFVSAFGASRWVGFNVVAELGGITLPGLRTRATAGLGEAVAEVIGADLATCIVGHVTPITARLWFRSHVGAPAAGHRFRWSVRRADIDRTRRLVRSYPVVPDPQWADTAVVDVRQLTADTPYQADLYLDGPGGSAWRLGGVSFRTAPIGPKATVRLAFASCHDATPQAPERWRALDEFAPDLTLLIGDQVYGDGIRIDGGPSTSDEWFARYSRRHAYSWSEHRTRNVLRRRATYMMLDDHDVKDDWGTKFATDKPTREVPAERIEGALTAYHAFQQALSPPGRAARTSVLGAPIDYPFSWGHIGGYCLDVRTNRGVRGAGSPVLGSDQISRFQAWARGPARQHEAILLVSPVPLAFVDTPILADVLALSTVVVPLGAASLGALVGGAALGPLGAVAGWGVGSFIGTGAVSDIEITNGRVTEPDMADQWSATHNRADLAVVLDALFDLANDAARPRAVIVLGGDIHLGAIHELRSSHAAHAECPVIWQFTSSPIGASPAAKLLDHLSASDVTEVFDPDEWFTLCSTAGGSYSARISGGTSGLLPVRNFGTLVINRLDSGRRLLVRGTIRGATREPVMGFQLPRDLELALSYDLTRVGPPTAPITYPTPVRRR